MTVPERVVDLRSDTVTLPPPEMRRAIADAEVGDDVYGEDPSVNRLEELAAERFGKEAAVLVPSGTMANLLALLAQAPRGHKILVGDRSDIFLWEAGGASVAGGLIYEPIRTNPDGALDEQQIEAVLYGRDDPQRAPPAVICLENTHGMCGGRLLPQDHLDAIRRFANSEGLSVHLDGARIFNAAVASGLEVAKLAAPADSVCFCLSKGLAAPVGSVVVGNAELVARARRLRRLLGGGMRQAGFIAAAGLFALEKMVDRLREDHLNARRLGEGIRRLPGVRLDPGEVETNIVFWTLDGDRPHVSAVLQALEERGVRMLELDRGRIRAVTHYGIEPDDVARAVEVVGEVLERV